MGRGVIISLVIVLILLVVGLLVVVLSSGNEPTETPIVEGEGFKMGLVAEGPVSINPLNNLGTSIIRQNSWFTQRGTWVRTGLDVGVAYDNSLETLVTVEGIAHYTPKDYSSFKSNLRELISGDKDIVKYWQLGNEPDLLWMMSGKTSDDYVEFFLELQPIIRDECPECKIVLAGISNQYDSGDNYEYFRDVLTKIKERSPDSKPFDVFDMHLYPFDDANYNMAERAVEEYKTLLQETGYDYPIELISTEFGMYSGQPKGFGEGLPFQTEEVQAQVLIKGMVQLFNGGLTKVSWSQLVNSYAYGHDNQNEGGIWDIIGLVYNGKGSYDLENNIAEGTKKESYFAYKTLASKVVGKTQVDKIAKGVYKFYGDSEVVYVAWKEDSGRLPSEISGEVKVTDHLGKEEVVDAESIILDSNPIFIEMM